MVNICACPCKSAVACEFQGDGGKREIAEEIDTTSTLRQILDKLAKKYGRDFQQIIDLRTGAISLEFLVSINRQIVRGTNVRLNNNEFLMITILAGGG